MNRPAPSADQTLRAEPEVRREVSLQALNTLDCPCVAEQFCTLSRTDEESLRQAVRWLDAQPGGLILGAGSNVVLATPRVPAVLHVGLRGIEELTPPPGAPADERLVRAAAGEIWHELVQWTLARQCYGLENLALIPGTVGAAPVQNIGAYGVELADRLAAVEAFDRVSNTTLAMTPADCRFGYRDSIFKQQPGRWLITAVQLRLSARSAPQLDYGNLRQELQASGHAEPSAEQVAQAVCRIRTRKLPDPAVLGNAGSFFKNPVVAPATAASLQQQWPSLPVFPASTTDGSAAVKLPAGWLIEQCGFKGWRQGDAGVHDAHALVLVNYGQASGQDIVALAGQIIASVQATFGVLLEPEPLIVRDA